MIASRYTHNTRRLILIVVSYTICYFFQQNNGKTKQNKTKNPKHDATNSSNVRLGNACLNDSQQRVIS